MAEKIGATVVRHAKKLFRDRLVTNHSLRDILRQQGKGFKAPADTAGNGATAPFFSKLCQVEPLRRQFIEEAGEFEQAISVEFCHLFVMLQSVKI